MAMSRSDVMSRIRSRGTKLEIKFRASAKAAGIRLFVPKTVYGKPDFCIVKTKVMIFINSCFWHGCTAHCRMPATRKSYWEPKIKSNVIRQFRVVRNLRRQGYSVYIFWEHDFSGNSIESKIKRLLNAIK